MVFQSLQSKYISVFGFKPLRRMFLVVLATIIQIRKLPTFSVFRFYPLKHIFFGDLEPIIEIRKMSTLLAVPVFEFQPLKRMFFDVLEPIIEIRKLPTSRQLPYLDYSILNICFQVFQSIKSKYGNCRCRQFLYLDLGS